MLLLRILLGICSVLSSTTYLGVAGTETWSLVFDAGSSGTRLGLFKIKREQGKPDVFTQFTPEGDDDQGVAKEDKLKLSPGLSGRLQSSSDAADARAKVRADLKQLLAEAAQYVPQDLQATTPVRLGATAGLRLLKIKEQDDVMKYANEALADKTINPFNAQGAIVLSGEEEAVYGWLAVNYFLGNFNTYDEDSTVGALDLGGASTQISYHSPSQVLEGQQSAIVNGDSYRIFATSFLKYGGDQFEEQVYKHLKEKLKATNSTKENPYANPCQCKSYPEEREGAFFVGTGKWDECSTLVGEVLGLDKLPCVFTEGNGRCTLVGKYLAPLPQNFYAFSAYFYTANGIGLLGWSEAKKLSANDFKTAGTTWCATVTTEFTGSSAQYKPAYCLRSAYVYHLLSQAYGFGADDKTSVTFARKVNGFEASWAMGLAMSYSPSSDIASIESERDAANKRAADALKAQKDAEDEMKAMSGGVGIGAGHGLAICVAIIIAFTALV